MYDSRRRPQQTPRLPIRLLPGIDDMPTSLSIVPRHIWEVEIHQRSNPLSFLGDKQERPRNRTQALLLMYSLNSEFLVIRGQLSERRATSSLGLPFVFHQCLNRHPPRIATAT